MAIVLVINLLLLVIGRWEILGETFNGLPFFIGKVNGIGVSNMKLKEFIELYEGKNNYTSLRLKAKKVAEKYIESKDVAGIAQEAIDLIQSKDYSAVKKYLNMILSKGKFKGNKEVAKMSKEVFDVLNT